MAKNRRQRAPRDRKRPFGIEVPRPPGPPEPPKPPPPPSPPGPGCGTGPDPLKLLKKRPFGRR